MYNKFNNRTDKISEKEPKREDWRSINDEWRIENGEQ